LDDNGDEADITVKRGKEMIETKNHTDRLKKERLSLKRLS